MTCNTLTTSSAPADLPRGRKIIPRGGFICSLVPLGLLSPVSMRTRVHSGVSNGSAVVENLTNTKAYPLSARPKRTTPHAPRARQRQQPWSSRSRGIASTIELVSFTHLTSHASQTLSEIGDFSQKCATRVRSQIVREHKSPGLREKSGHIVGCSKNSNCARKTGNVSVPRMRFPLRPRWLTAPGLPTGL